MNGTNQKLIVMYMVATGNMQIRYNKDPDEEEPDAIHDYFGSERANEEPSVGIEQRIKRCYELAAWPVLARRAPEGSTVVHGSWHGPGAAERIGHGWVKIKPHGLVWEPIRGLVYLEDDFYRWTRAWDEVEYNRDTLVTMTLSHNHFGRWHESRYP